MIVGWIRSLIEAKVKSTVSFVSNAHQLWEDLKQRFSVGNEVCVHQIKAQLASCRQDGQSVLEYYGKLCKLWDELHNYYPPPVCSCGGCSCGVTAKYATKIEKEKLHQFLLGLDDARFGGLCTNLVGTTPLPSLGEAYSKVIHEEQRLSSARGREQLFDVIGFVARREASESFSSSVQDTTSDSIAYLGCSDPQGSNKFGSSSLLKSGGRKLCSHCGTTWHDKLDCWQLVGFPDCCLTKKQPKKNKPPVVVIDCLDHFSKTLIGSGEERDGVYHLKEVVSAKIHSVKAAVDDTLWHQRLGHPSFSVLSDLPMFSSASK
ncbi:PREDICTED: uncharacterized protein LOC109129162 [Camelina sativa]|uniref:Uncharacterized protein LOC109129162 n=1 Tax=Camelina sativa TaxID=90675 RepID=A0ABM1R024_CAMSA|nr:PREDICTED: uncharacterized protein LOC109129162 [Camelina sativa]